MSDSVRSHRRQPTRLPRPWDSPGKNTGVGCHFLLQCMKVRSESEVAQLCPTLSDPMDCSPPGSSVPGIFQARVLEWGAIAFSASLTARQQIRVCLRSSLKSPSKKVNLCEGVCLGKKVSVFLGGLTTPPAPGAPEDVETRLFRALEPRPQERLLLSPASVSPYSQQKNNPWECVPGP